MTKKIMPILCMAVCILMLVSSYSMAGVRQSKHDFSTGPLNPSPVTQFPGPYTSVNSGEIIAEVCVFCHTPHHSSTDAARGTNNYLWNRTNSTYNYIPYSSSTMTTAITIDNPPRGITLMCMSCHDGVTTIQNIINAPGGGAADTLDPLADQIGDVFPSWLGGAGPNIGGVNSGNWAAAVDLSNDHPVSFTWVNGIPGIKDPSTWPANTVKLFTLGGNARMECATCHEPHDNTTYPPFLRMSNANSAMCTTCHDK